MDPRIKSTNVFSFLVSPPGRSLSPLSGNRTAFHRQDKSYHLPASQSGIDGMTPVQALRQEFTLLNLNSPVFKIEKVEKFFSDSSDIGGFRIPFTNM